MARLNSTMSQTQRPTHTMPETETELMDVIRDAVSEVLRRSEGLRGPYVIRNSDSNLYSSRETLSTARKRRA